MDCVDKMENNNIANFQKALRSFSCIEVLDHERAEHYEKELEEYWKINWDDVLIYFDRTWMEPDHEAQYREDLMRKWCLASGREWEFFKVFTTGRTDDLRWELFGGLPDVLYHICFQLMLQRLKFRKVQSIYRESDATDFGNLPLPAISGRIIEKSLKKNNIENYFAEPKSGRAFYEALYGNREKKNVFRTYSDRVVTVFFEPNRLCDFWDTILENGESDILDLWLLFNCVDLELIGMVYQDRSKKKLRYGYDKKMLELLCQCRWPHMRHFFASWYYHPQLSEREIRQEERDGMALCLEKQVKETNRFFHIISSLLWDEVSTRDECIVVSVMTKRLKEWLTRIRKRNGELIGNKTLYAHTAYEVITELKEGRRAVLEMELEVPTDVVIEMPELTEEQIFDVGNIKK